MTPWQFKIAMEAFASKEIDKHNANVWVAWHAAHWSTLKKMPSLSKYIIKKENIKNTGTKKPKQKINEYAIKEFLLGVNEFNKNKKGKKT